MSERPEIVRLNVKKSIFNVGLFGADRFVSRSIWKIVVSDDPSDPRHVRGGFVGHSYREVPEVFRVFCDVSVVQLPLIEISGLGVEALIHDSTLKNQSTTNE